MAGAGVKATGGMDGVLRILVVDDRADFRQAFASVLGAQPDLEVVAQAGSLAEARTMLEGVDVALLDRGLPDGDGLKLMRPLRDANPHARVFVMSATVELRHPEDAIEAGADGVIDKLDAPEAVFAAIRGGGARVPASPPQRASGGGDVVHEHRPAGVPRSSLNPV
jgi:DNA-binding NarL/FixJ family response regulator